MTVRAMLHGGDGAYFLDDPAHELDGIRPSGPGIVLRGAGDHRGVLAGLFHGPSRRAVDLVVAAPKPVSVLLALEPLPRARRLVELHECAVASTLEYLADVATLGGNRAVGDAVGFTHGVNRRLDPHLHTHVVLGGPAGPASSVAFALRRFLRAADALYLASLREGLTAALGRSSWIDAAGALQVQGVDRGLVVATTSPRRRDGRVERVGAKPAVEAAAVRRHWRETLERAVPLDTPVPPVGPHGHIDEHRFACILGDGLVGHPEVVAAFATACTFGATPRAVLVASELLAGGRGQRRTVPAISLRGVRAVRALGPRPMDPRSLRTWQERSQTLGTELARRAKGRSPTRVLAAARELTDPPGAR